MKRLTFILSLLLLVVFSGCGRSYDSLEEYISSNEEYASALASKLDVEESAMDVTGNTMTLSYDLGKMDSVDRQTYNTVFDSMAADLEEQMNAAIDDIEEGSRLRDISIKVVYKAGDKVIWQHEYTGGGEEEKE